MIGRVPGRGWGAILAVATGLLPAASLVAQTSPTHQARFNTISWDLLKHPLPAKARSMLRNALRLTESGDHRAAIKQLEETLSKYPSSAAYTQSLLGVEYLKVDRIPEAVDSLQEAVTLLPHDAFNHANLGISLVADGQIQRGELELKRAIELDRENTSAAQRLLDAIQKAQTATSSGSAAERP